MQRMWAIGFEDFNLSEEAWIVEVNDRGTKTWFKKDISVSFQISAIFILHKSFVQNLFGLNPEAQEEKENDIQSLLINEEHTIVKLKMSSTRI